MPDPLITSIRLTRLALPLTVPYKLSFGPVKAFDTVICEIETDDGGYGFGEATILTGYTPETIADCWAAIWRFAGGMVGQTARTAKTYALANHAQAPFTVTALVTAVEMATQHPMLTEATGQRVPLLAILNASDPAGIEAELAHHAAAGYDTVKVKVGWNVDDDLARVAFIQSHLPPGVRIRIDGNQGYTPEDGVRFASEVLPDAIELLEQPCHMDDWAAAEMVAAVGRVPFMLDESIYGDAEIERAANIDGVTHIKLKLMKAGSLDQLVRQLESIRAHGMTPVLGNGVAADPGCWMEACVARRCIDNAGEMNGFLKPRTQLFADALVMDGGAVILPAEPPTLMDLSPFTTGSTVIEAS